MRKTFIVSLQFSVHFALQVGMFAVKCSPLCFCLGFDMSPCAVVLTNGGSWTLSAIKRVFFCFGLPSAAERKRGAEPSTDASLSKTAKLASHKFCVYIGNLNRSKSCDEVRDSLAAYLMTQSILFQDVRLDRSKKHAFVDLASEMDLQKCLMLDGEKVLDVPLKIATAKVRSEGRVQKKAAPRDKKVKEARSLFLKNLPFDAKKEDILKFFKHAVAVRFPGRSKRPSRGIAFVEFKNTRIAKRTGDKKQGVKFRGRVLVVAPAGDAGKPPAGADQQRAENAPSPSSVLVVSSLGDAVEEKQLQKAVSVRLQQTGSTGKGLRDARVEFPSVEDAEEAFRASQNIKICQQTAKAEFCPGTSSTETVNAEPKTLVVLGLAKKTTARTLQSAFEGALRAHVPVNPATGLSKRFGFVDFESQECCKAAKEAMEDCEIDGSKVTIAFANSKGERGHHGGSVGRSTGTSVGRRKRSATKGTPQPSMAS
uniref:RRM domain-containing protein n=1 Tax=Oryzias sinensis TaxID=183150 RepID=A0A8C8DK29_9TELE